MFQEIIQWAEAHPVLMTALVWPIVTAIFNFVFKWRTKEEFDAMNPYLRAVLQVTSSLGVDPVKAVKAVKEHVPSKS